MSEHAGLRHLYTAADQKPGRAGGFQSLAYSAQLEPLAAEIETLVEGYSAPEGAEPRCRQLLQVPGAEAYALSTFTALGPTPDQRSGNYLADTVVVPETWLAAAGWDAAAAFAALPWMAPADLPDLGATLRPVELPALAPGPLERLALLPRVVPDDLLAPLVLAIARQSFGLGPLHLLASPESDPEDLEQLVLLLPLLVPPSLRSYQVERERRCLTLRTHSPLRRMVPAADLTGHPGAAAAGLEQEGAEVIDLGGIFEVAPAGNSKGREAYARWLIRVLREGRWSALRALYQEPFSGRPEAFFARFTADAPRLERDLGAAGAEPVAPPVAPEVVAPRATPELAPPAGAAEPAPPAAAETAAPAAEAPADSLALRHQAWDARDDAEGRAFELLEMHREAFQHTLDDFRAALEKATGDASEAIEQMVRERTGAVAEQTDVLQRAWRRERSQEADLKQRLTALEQQLGGLEKQLKRIRQQLADLSGRDAALPPPGEVGSGEGVYVSRRARDAVAWLRAVRIAGWRLGTVVIAGLVVIIVALGAWILVLGSGSAGGGSDPTAVERVAEQRRQARRKELLTGLQEGATAAALLRRATADQALGPRAQVVTILAAGKGIQLGETARVALLQQALEIAVDGGWGAGSQQALQDKLGTCKPCLPENPPAPASLAFDGRAAHCVMRRALGAEAASCAAESPWGGERSWTEEKARRALDLIRAARAQAGATAAAALPDLEQMTATLLDALAGTDRLSAAQAERLLGLAFAVVTQTDQPRAPAALSDGQLEALEALLDSLRAGGGGAG